MASLRESLLGAAEARATEALKATEVPTLAAPQATGATGQPLVPSFACLVEEDLAVGIRAADPELAEALARSKALEWTQAELAMVKSLTASTIQSVLTNGSEKGKLTAAKLGILLAKIEYDRYLELRRQSLESQPRQRRTVFQFPSSYAGQLQQGLREGLRDVTPAKEPKDA